MTYELSEDQASLRKRIRELAEGRILPRAEGIDEKAELPKGVLDDLAKYQWLSLVVPEDYAGAGASPLTVCVVIYVRLGFPRKFSEEELPVEEIPQMTSAAAGNFFVHTVNVRKATEQAVRQLFEASLKGWEE